MGPKAACFHHVEQQPTELISLSREPRKNSYKLNLILLRFLGIQFWVFIWKKKSFVGCVITKWCMSPGRNISICYFLWLEWKKSFNYVSFKNTSCHIQEDNYVQIIYVNMKIKLWPCCNVILVSLLIFSYDIQHEPDLERHAASRCTNLTSRPHNNQRLEDQWRGAIR